MLIFGALVLVIIATSVGVSLKPKSKTKVDKSLNTTFPSETERYEKILEGLKIQLKI